MAQQNDISALLLIDHQKGFNDIQAWGHERSNPAFEANLSDLLSAFRKRKQQHQEGATPPPTTNTTAGVTTTHIIHVCHISTDPSSPFHPSHDSGNGIEFLPIAAPLPDEPTVSKSVNSAFIGTRLEDMLRERRVNRLFVCGLTTDHCVSTTVRMAANLGVVDFRDVEDGSRDESLRRREKKGRIVLVEDATATFDRGKWNAEMVHSVSVESLKGEFADIMTTRDVVALLRAENRKV